MSCALVLNTLGAPGLARCFRRACTNENVCTGEGRQVPLCFAASSVSSFCRNRRSTDEHCASDQASVVSLTFVRVVRRAWHGNNRSVHPNRLLSKARPINLNHGDCWGLLPQGFGILTGMLPQALCLGCLRHFGHHHQADAFCPNGLKEEFTPFRYDKSARIYTFF